MSARYIGSGADFAIIRVKALSDRLYLDHAATTPVLPVARKAVADALTKWANPSSPHGDGRVARAQLEEARERIKAALNWPHELIFTSGATESLALALASDHDALLVSATEHDAVHRAAPDAYFLPVTSDGVVARDALFGRLAAMGAGKPLVAIQHVNNETGVIQPLDMLAEVVSKAGGVLLADCAQSAFKLPLPEADLIAISGHKLGAPPGIGALLVKDLGLLKPVGGQEKGYRAGTENLPGALGLAAAVEAKSGWVARADDLRAHLDGAIEGAGGQIVSKSEKRLSTISAYRMPGKQASAQLIQFDMAGISVSAGSACSSGTLKASKVLAAMGWSETEANEVIRVSFGPETKRADIYRFVEVWKRIAQ